MASGRSAAVVSRIGLPLSSVSTIASIAACSSMRSAILFRTRARSAGDVLAQPALAACAASSAFSMSSAFERATSHNGRPVTGVGFDEVLAAHRRHPLAADKIIVLRPNDDALLQFLERLMDHGTPPSTHSRCATDRMQRRRSFLLSTFAPAGLSVNDTLVEPTNRLEKLLSARSPSNIDIAACRRTAPLRLLSNGPSVSER